METLKNALKSVNKFGLLAIVLVAFATLAFKVDGVKTKANRFSQTWVFKGSLLVDAATANSTNYALNPGTLPTGCGSGSNLPCQIITPTSVDTFGELQTYLNDTFNGDPEEIRDGADSRKP